MEDMLTHLDGVAFTASIQRNPTAGKIKVVDGVVYLCQDKVSGSNCGPNKYGFKYSWSVQTGSTRDLESNSVTDLRLLGSDGDILKETLRVGMQLELGDLKMNVLLCVGELVIGEYIYPEGNVASPNLLKSDLISNGWKISKNS